MVVMDEVATTKNFFDSHQVHLSNAWLESCINWCREENLPPNYTLKELQLKVYEQWLLLDLRDVEVPCLPLNLSNKKQYTLTGNYTLQMMQVIDISKPKHWQLQKIRNTISKNAEQETQSSKRVLQLTLTDGVQEVEAMEFQPIPNLTLNLTPGIKIRIMGPISVRRGRLMLQSENVKILGGEVEDLIVPNAAENVLARFLKLPLNLNPQVVEESLLTANKDMFEQADEAGVTVPQNQNVRNSAIATNRTSNGATDNGPKPPFSNLQTRNNIGIDEEEEMRIAAEINLLMEMEKEFEEPVANKNKSTSRTPDMFDDMSDFEFESIDIAPSAVIKGNTNLPKPPVAVPETLDLSKSLEFEDDVFANIDIDAHLDQIDRNENRSQIPSKPTILTIAKLVKNIPNISNGKFKIKAKYKSVVEKLTVIDDKLHLVVKVGDESEDITVKIHSEVVADMAGIGQSALMSLKTATLENQPEAQQKVLESLRKVKAKLLQLDNVVEVQVSVAEKFPVIVNIL